MPKYPFKPTIVVDARDPIQARNNLLRMLAQAELDGHIYRFTVPHKPEAEG